MTGRGRAAAPAPPAAAAAVVAADLAIARRGAARVENLPGGCALTHPGLARVHRLNTIHLATAPTAGDVERVAERWLGGLGHRRVVLDDHAAGERLAPALAERGWERTRTRFMALGPLEDPPARDPRARELTDDELEAVQRAAFTCDAPGLAGELAGAQRALRRGTPARGFGAGQGGELHSTATAFLDPDVTGRRVATIDQVATLREHREQGLARATLAAALRAAATWGADLVTVAVDADDWPQLIYARLGFAPVARQVAFTRRADPVRVRPDAV